MRSSTHLGIEYEYKDLKQDRDTLNIKFSLTQSNIIYN